MKVIRLILAITLLFLCSVAIAGKYDWVIQKMPKNLADVDKSTYVVGVIGKQEYLAIHMNVGDESQDVFKPVLVFARVMANSTYEPFKVFELENSSDFSIQFKNESIYIRHDTAHHGVYFTKFQFKLTNGIFLLVGLEDQSITPSHYAGIEKNIELWEGVSANFTTSEATYWGQAFDMDRPQEWREWELALKLHAQGLSSSKGKKRKVKLRPGGNWDFNNFDLYNFKTDFLCHYFDYDLRFKNSCK